ncbi:BPIB4 protein, partial [Orthonyx spaldingii]|nr:BPIB4 protein [Orthonyx spaldingii]
PKMSVFWTVVLLNSLLIPSPGLGIPSWFARPDMNDGLLGGLLGGDGAVGGLLGGDGLLGGLLGGDGLLGGLLGKDGVVGGLLDKDGVLGGLLGKDILGLRIVNNTLPKISVRSLPGFGHQVDFNTQLLVESSSVPGQPLCEQVEVDVTMLVQDTWTAHGNAMNCKTIDINTYVRYESGVRPRVPVLDEPLKRLLSDVLQDLGCNILNARLRVMSSLLGSGNQVLPLGALGDLPSFSILSGDAIQMDLNLLSENARGGVMTPMQGLPLAATLQLATGRLPRLSLSQDTFSALLEQVQGQGALNLSITSLMESTSPLQGQLAQVLPGSLPLELRVRVSDEPVVAVSDGGATVTLKASIDAISPALQTPQGLLFSVDVDIVLNITPSVSDGKLQTSLALDSINLTRFPSSLDASTASSLAEWFKKVLTAVYVPSLKDAFRVSIPLPNVLNTSLRNAEVDITDVRI